MIFGTLNLEKIWHENLTSHLPDVAIVPLEIKKVIISSIIYAYFWLFLISQKKTNCNPLSHLTRKNVITRTCELQHFFIWLKICRVLSNVGGSEKSQLWIVVGGSEKNRLCCVATGMSGKQCHSKCSKWSPSALIHASSLFRHWSVA